MTASIAVLLGIGWADRRHFAAHFVDRELAAAGVAGRYRITALGPFEQVIEDVRLGDPAHPDFAGRRITLQWRYRFGLPALSAIKIEGGRLAAQWRDGRLSLGAIDRLLPRSPGGGPLLPDMRVTLQDSRARLTMPQGTADIAIEGSGNPARDFHGLIRADAPALTVSGCHIRRMTARLSVTTTAHRPRLQGPIAIDGATCAPQSLSLGRGKSDLDLRLTPRFDGASGTIASAGFGGEWGRVRFGALRGDVRLDGGKPLRGSANLALLKVNTPMGGARSLSLNGAYRIDRNAAGFRGRLALHRATATPRLRAAIRSAFSAAGASPLGPLAEQLGRRIGAIAAGTEADIPLSLSLGATQSLRIDGATIRSGDGASAALSGTFTSRNAGWTVDGHIAGDALPSMEAHVEQTQGQAAIHAVVRTEPYRAGRASLALTPARIAIANGTAQFDTVATLSGPIGDGSIEGLVLPLSGTIRRDGAFRIGTGCNPVRFRRLRISALALDPGHVTVCGAPVIARSGAGALRIAAEARNVRLTGHSGASPLTLRAAALRLSSTGFAADHANASLGTGDDPTHLSIGTISGTFTSAGLSGKFADAAGAIGAVPLALSGATGDWRLAQGALHLKGALQVADRAPSPRFLPLVSQDVALSLREGVIDATASLKAPGHDPTIAQVTLRHDLADATGHAVLAVPGIPFQLKRLQPEMLTPLTLGIVANVAGTVRGQGRIDWSPAGITSSGTFDTDRVDLAAAFGPVTGLSGTIHFTDLLGLVTAPHQEARIAVINPGVEVTNGVVHYRLIGGNRVMVEDARWPFAGGTLTLDPTTLDFAQAAERRLTFRIAALDAAAFIQQLDFPNISATGTFDGQLPMIFGQTGGRIENGTLTARGPGTLAYVGNVTNADLGTMGKLAFDALKKIRYSGLEIALGGNLDGEIITRVRFDGVRQATGESGLVARMIRNLPFRFNIQIQAPFRGLVGSARSYVNPALLLQPGQRPAAVQPADSAAVP